MPLKNDLLLRAARGEKTERTPVWLMRQAGRVLPEYRKVREKVGGFRELVTTPAYAAEVTIQPVDILGVDAAILFSDILVVPEAMGLPYDMLESRGPWFEKTITSARDVDALRIANGSDLSYVIDTVRLVKKDLNDRVPLIGFAGAPWTIFCYMTEGHGSKTFSRAKKFLYTDAGLSHSLLEKITASTLKYLQAQADAGVDAVQLFDSWAGVLGPAQYKEYSLAYISRICSGLAKSHPGLPVIVFAKGAFFARADMASLECSVIGLDWNMDITESRRLVGPGKSLQGNMDPCLLYADFATIRDETRKMLSAFGPVRHIANLGHGLYPDLEKDKVQCFVDSVKEYDWAVAGEEAR